MELDHRPAAARAEGPAIPWFYSLQAGVDRQPDSLGLHLPAFQFRREELSTDSSTHLKKSPLSSASERVLGRGQGTVSETEVYSFRD